MRVSPNTLGQVRSNAAKSLHKSARFTLVKTGSAGTFYDDAHRAMLHAQSSCYARPQAALFLSLARSLAKAAVSIPIAFSASFLGLAGAARNTGIAQTEQIKICRQSEIIVRLNLSVRTLSRRNLRQHLSVTNWHGRSIICETFPLTHFLSVQSPLRPWSDMPSLSV